jgi:membrane protease YdiL (CAAX protease family)
MTTLVGVGLALFGPLALAAASERVTRGPARLGESLAGQAVLVAILLAVLWIAFGVERLPPEALGFRPLRWQALAWGAALALFFNRAYGPALYFAITRLRLRGFEGGLAKLAGLPRWYLVLAVIVGGTAEEILYRGYAIGRLEALTGSVWLAVLIPVAVFALAHVPLWGAPAALSTAFAGAIFTVFYLWQGDLTPNVIAHVTTDFVGIVLPRARVRAGARSRVSERSLAPRMSRETRGSAGRPDARPP